MVSSIGSAGAMSSDYISQMRENMFKTLDSGGDGKLDKTEITQALGGGSQGGSSASSLISALDSDGDSSISRLEFEAGMSKLHHGMKHKQSGDSEDLFKKIDANGDGSISKDEFVSNRPKGVSEEQADQMWSLLDTSGTGSLTESRFESAMTKQGPPHGPPPGRTGGRDDFGQVSSATDEGGSATDETTQTGSSASTSNDSVLKQLLSAAMTRYLQNTSGYLEQALSSGGLTACA